MLDEKTDTVALSAPFPTKEEFAVMYARHLAAKEHLHNERLRPEGVDLFSWLLEKSDGSTAENIKAALEGAGKIA